MHTTLFMAMSANGMIADENGSEDFLSSENWKTTTAFVKEYGNLIIGRKTYEAVKEWDTGYGFDDFTEAVKIIISADTSYVAPDRYTAASSPEGALAILEEKGFETAFVTGGPTVNTAFAKAGLLDEVVLNVEPAILGEGKSLFAPADFDIQLELQEVHNVTNQIVQLRYTVIKHAL